MMQAQELVSREGHWTAVLLVVKLVALGRKGGQELTELGSCEVAVTMEKHMAATSGAPYDLKNWSILLVERSSIICCKMSTGRRFSSSSTPIAQ